MTKPKGCKVSGVELKRFWADPKVWDGKYYEDATIFIDGNEIDEDDDPVAYCEDSTQVVVIGGMMRKHDSHTWEGPSLESTLRVWMKQQVSEFVLVEVAKDRKDKLLEAVKSVGGRVIK